MEFHNTKPKTITTTNHRKGNVTRCQWELEVKAVQPPEARENACDQVVLILNLIGWESGVSFVDQLHNEVKQNKAILDFFRLLI